MSDSETKPCRECTTEIPKKAKRCPHCTASQAKPKPNGCITFLLYVFFFILFLFVLNFVVCGGLVGVGGAMQAQEKAEREAESKANTLLTFTEWTPIKAGGMQSWRRFAEGSTPTDAPLMVVGCNRGELGAMVVLDGEEFLLARKKVAPLATKDHAQKGTKRTVVFKTSNVIRQVIEDCR